MSTTTAAQQHNSVIESFSDNSSYDFTVALYNGITSLRVPKKTIKDLVIEDDILDWYGKGYIDILSPSGALEQSITYIEEQIRETYIFRNDSREFLTVDITPNIYDGDDLPKRINDSIFTLKYDFAIYSIKDVTTTNPQDKIKRLYFWDVRYQIFRDKNNWFTTTDYLSGNTSHMRDEERKIPTGVAIRNLIIDTITPGAGNEEGEVFSPDWDYGADTIHYTSPANNRAIDDLEALLSVHVSEDGTSNQECILRIDRFSRVWELIPIGTIFDYACEQEQKGTEKLFGPGRWQTEKFTITRQIGHEEDRSLLQKTRVPQGGGLHINANYGRNISSITNYTFIEMRGDINQKILNTTPVHQYDIKNKRFSINMTDTNVNNTINHIRSNVINNMVVDSKVKKVPISSNIDGDRVKNFSLDHIFTSSVDNSAVLSSSRNKAIKNFIMQSNAIEFTVPGHTTRQACRFISVSHNQSFIHDAASYNDKVDGQYLVISVIHRFSGMTNQYDNKIIGVKPYNYTQIFATDEQAINVFEKSDE